MLFCNLTGSLLISPFRIKGYRIGTRGLQTTGLGGRPPGTADQGIAKGLPLQGGERCGIGDTEAAQGGQVY